MASKSAQTRPTMVGIGAGGHARVMIHTARRCGWEVRLLIDRCGQENGSELDGVPIQYLDDEAFLQQHLRQNPCEPVAVFIGTPDGSDARAAAYRKVKTAGIDSPNLLDPNAIIEPFVKMGCGVHVLSGATVAVGAALGNDALVNHRAIVEHDVIIGDHVHVATAAILCGGVMIEDRCLVGAGAVVLPGRKVAMGSIVGAGAVVTRDVPPATIVAGNPAKQIRCLSSVQVARRRVGSFLPIL
ncbi:MAG: NeuD/PglB/VioB family sugar acetyltransferase [Rubripirellula sp.]|nr:NeuD/PglB/VioB family sugar acetyltransferase [Rubripirellula sp.]